MAVLTHTRNGYDNPTGYYLDDKLYGEVHVNDEYEKEGILLGLLSEGVVTKVVELDLDDLLDEYDVIEEKFNGYFEHPESLAELKAIIKSVS